MLKFRRIELRNFLSFGNAVTELDLEFNGTTLILGENMDASGANGVGKSTIINGISFGLYNKPISNISKERLINRTNNSKNTAMEVRLYFAKGEDEYEIYRARGEINATVLKRNDEDITPDSVSAIDKAIEDIVGFSYDLFSRVIVFAGSATPFLDLPVSTQRNHIEELFNITTLTQKALALREKIKQTESDVKVQDALIQQQELTRDLRSKHLSEAESRILKWEDEKADELKNIQSSLDKIDGIDFDAEQKIHEEVNSIVEQIGLKRVSVNQYIKNLTDNFTRFHKWSLETSQRFVEVKALLKKLDGVDVAVEQALHQVIAENTQVKAKAQSSLALINAEKNTLIKRLDAIKQELDHLKNSKCPYCSQHFDSKEKIAELEVERLAKEDLLEQVYDKTASETLVIQTAQDAIADAKSKIKHADVNELMTAFANKQSLEAELAQLNASVNPYGDAIVTLLDEDPSLDYTHFIVNNTENLVEVTDYIKSGSKFRELTELEEKLQVLKEDVKHDNLNSLLGIRTNADNLKRKLTDLANAVNPHLEAYETLLSEGDTVVDYATRDAMKVHVEHQQFLLKLLTDKNSFIRKNIVNQTIPFLNAQINAYTKELGLPHIVRFDPDMSCSVRECGRDLDFGNLSGGEKKRVNLALSLAFRDVLHHLHSKVNMLMLDEIDGGSVDTLGVSAMVRLLKRKARDEGMGVWTISHHPEMLGRMDREMVVRKENGFSSILLPDMI